MKIMNEFRQLHNLLKIEVTTLEEAQARFRYAAAYEYQGHKYSATGARYTRKKPALRHAEYQLVMQLVRVMDGKGRSFREEFREAESERDASLREGPVDHKVVEDFQARSSRQQDEARLKRVFHWLPANSIEPLLETAMSEMFGAPTVAADLVESVGARIAAPNLKLFYAALQAQGWADRIRDYAKQVELDDGTRNSDLLGQFLEEESATDDPDERDALASSDEGEVSGIASQASIDAESIDIGHWSKKDEFLSLWGTKNLPQIEFNKHAYVMSLSFKRHQIQYKIKNLLREMSEPARLEGDLLAEKPTFITLSFSLRGAPKLMQKSPGRSLFVRSSDFSSVEAWNHSSLLRVKFAVAALSDSALSALLWTLDSSIRVGMIVPEFSHTYSVVSNLSLPPYSPPMSLRDLSASVRFKLQCLVSKRIIVERDVSQELVEALRDSKHAGTPDGTVCSALNSIEAKGIRCFDIVGQVRSALSSFKQCQLNQSSRSENTHYVSVFHLTITPLRMWCDGPVAEISNRVLRNFPEHKDRFIRVSFKDEDGKSSIRAAGRSLIRDRVLRILESGFTLPIMGLRYSWLVFSSGQLRNHKTWFFAENEALSCSRLRSWMGRFDGIYNVALFSSRLGQALSSTYPTIEMKPDEERRMPDVKRNGYCFSDGVGTVSMEMAKDIAKCLPIHQHDLPPSAFQIRLGGVKGVISVDPRLSGRIINIRPSMDKFPSQHRNIEVISWAKSIPAHLNRQLILILSDLGVPDEVFLEAQATALQRVHAVKQLGDSKSPVATATQIDLLESTWRAKNKLDSLPARAVQMLRAGFSPHEEPFLFSTAKPLAPLREP